MRTLIIVALQFFSSIALAENSLKIPHIKTCTRIVNCESGTNALTLEEKEKLAELMTVIKAGSTEAEISAVYSEPHLKIPPMHVRGLPPNTLIYAATWYVTAQKEKGSHIYVHFINNAATDFQWWTADLKTNVTVDFED